MKGSIQHSLEAMQALGVPTHVALFLSASAAHLPAVDAGLELGRCYFRASLGKTLSSQTDEERPSYSVNVTNYCPALQVGLDQGRVLLHLKS